MAAVDPALPSPLGPASHQRAERRQNASPPPQSKRDRKRQAVVEKIAFLTEKFNQNRDTLYREQLHQIQIDTSLVLQANPYADRPLDGLTADHRKEHAKDAQGAKSLLGMAGPRYLDWVHEIEDLVEHRDFDLTRQNHEYERKCAEYRNTHAYRVEVAKREHKTLSDTLRDRLINVITSKKVRLNKEKEALDISDASALLLHPNQFTYNNPASPSGNHGKRATRLRRDADDISGYDNGKKRKRMANDDDGSPAPSRQRLDPNGTTSLWQTDRMKSTIGTGKTAFPPEVYSLEKLFTEKELTMTHNTAALVAHKHIQTHPVGRDGLVVDSPSGSTDTAGNDDEEHLVAPMMERHHSTRSTRGGHAHPSLIDDKVLGQDPLQTFDNINLERISFQEPKLPPMAGFQYNKGYGKSNEVNTPLPLPQDEVNSDLAVIDMFKRYEETRGAGANFAVENGGRQLLEAGIKRDANGFPAFYRPSVDSIIKTHPQGPTSNMRDEANNVLHPPAHSHLHAQAATSSPMSRQSSLGDVGMSRQGSGRGKRRA